MATLSDKQITRLTHLVVGLQELVESLNSQGVKLTREQAANIEEHRRNGICLVCDLPLDGEIRRGSHQSCYNRIRDEIQRGDKTTQQAVDEGLWNPATEKPGRKSRRSEAIRKKRLATQAFTEAKKDKDFSGTKTGTKKRNKAVSD